MSDTPMERENRKLRYALKECAEALAFLRENGIYVWPNHPANPEANAWQVLGDMVGVESTVMPRQVLGDMVGVESTLLNLKQDAMRYRWLKANHLQTGPDSWIRTGDDLEEAIDAAMREKP